jgi:hypothetical protein
MRYKGIVVLLALLVVSLAATAVYAGGAVRVPAAIWAHGEIYDTVITPATFVAPPEHSTDIIYSFMISGLLGQRSVADSAPRDPEYNGGRWSVQMVSFTPLGVTVHDQNSDGYVDFELISEAEVLEHEALGHLEINDANFYFECPMLPRRGR